MRSQRGQATVEWTGLVLVVAAALTAAALGAYALGTAGLPDRLACAIAGGDCAPRRVFSAEDFRPLIGRTTVVGTREPSGGILGAVGSIPPAAGSVAMIVPAASVLEGAGGFLSRHRRTLRKVAVGLAIAGGVTASCVAAITAANVVGAVGCGSAVVLGGVAEYDNARR
jgi:hypothetical protein